MLSGRLYQNKFSMSQNKKTLIVSLFAASLLSFSFISNFESWIKFTSKDQSFSIEFPDTPAEQVQNIPTDVGDIEMHLFMHEVSDEEAYMVAYSDYPEEMVRQSDPQAMLDGAKNGGLENIFTDPILENEKDFMFNKVFPAKSFNARQKDGFYVNYLLIMKENRLYQIAIMKIGSYTDVKSNKQFFDSFKLKN